MSTYSRPTFSKKNSLDLLSEKKTALYCTKTSQSKSRRAAITPLPRTSNVVGYINSEYTTETHPSLGFAFVPVSGETSFKLNDYSVVSGTANKFMNPSSEYLQKLNDDTDVEGRYTYLSAAYIQKLMGKSYVESHLAAVGWWEYDSSWRNQWKTFITNGDYTHKCTDSVTFPVGTCFLGLFTGANNLKVVSNGQVPAAKPIEYSTATHPFICNFVPRTIDINEIVVDSTVSTKFMNPSSEYIQELDDNTDVAHRYTYLSAAYIQKLMGKNYVESHLAAVGWWEYDSSWRNLWKTFITNADYTHKITSKDIEPGRGFLGLFTGANSLRFTFPNSLDEKPTAE